MMSYPNLLARIFLIPISPWLPCYDWPTRWSSSFQTIPKLACPDHLWDCITPKHVSVFWTHSLPVLHCCFRVPVTGPLPRRDLWFTSHPALWHQLVPNKACRESSLVSLKIFIAIFSIRWAPLHRAALHLHYPKQQREKRCLWLAGGVLRCPERAPRLGRKYKSQLVTQAIQNSCKHAYSLMLLLLYLIQNKN